MKYKFVTTDTPRPLTTVVFEDEKYSLLGEMLVAERGLLSGMLDELDNVLRKKNVQNAEFSGNAFTLYITDATTNITDDISGGETEAHTKELRRLVKAYKKHNDKL
jgi:hypothetical protein